MESGRRTSNRARKKGSASLGRTGSRAKAMVRKVNTTLGDLIAAAFDTVGSEAKAVAELVSSSDMARAIGRRIVLT